MSRLSTKERKRLIDIMKCEREEGLNQIKKELEAEKENLISLDESLIASLDEDINTLKSERAGIERNISSLIEAAKLDNIAGYACGDTHERIRDYRQETNRLERDILLGANNG